METENALTNANGKRSGDVESHLAFPNGGWHESQLLDELGTSTRIPAIEPNFRISFIHIEQVGPGGCCACVHHRDHLFEKLITQDVILFA